MAPPYYPQTKRHTYLAQLALGYCLSWGVIMAAVALAPDPTPNARPSTICMALACILWLIIYDTIYAHQDEDDVQVGLKSAAVLFGDRTKLALWSALSCMVGLLCASGYFANFGASYYTLAVGGCSASLGVMILRVDIKDPRSCWWWSRYGF